MCFLPFLEVLQHTNATVLHMPFVDTYLGIKADTMSQSVLIYNVTCGLPTLLWYMQAQQGCGEEATASANGRRWLDGSRVQLS